jgi:hypothetical protein
MKVFISYASDYVELAARLAHSLRDEGDVVFFDRDTLPKGETYDQRIREAIESADLFLFLLSPEAIVQNSYALAELGIAQRASSEGGVRLLPVKVSETDFGILPTYLRSITILQPNGNLIAETLAAVAEVRRDLNRQQVSVTATMTNSGWILGIMIRDEHPREIFYRLGDDANFKSTGFTRTVDRQTGLPQPRMQATIPTLSGKRDLFVKYTDRQGRERGPYTLSIDANEQIVASTKDTLELTRPWVTFREYDGRLLVYFSHLRAYKKALKESQFSIDDESLSKRLRYVRDTSGGVFEISEDDEMMVEVPSMTRYVCVKLVFIDGSEWPAEHFNRT